MPNGVRGRLAFMSDVNDAVMLDFNAHFDLNAGHKARDAVESIGASLAVFSEISERVEKKLSRMVEVRG